MNAPKSPPTDHITEARTQRADARRNRQRILDAAETVFAQQGSKASTELISTLAGLGNGTIFRHFATKEDLLRAVAERTITRLTARAQELLATTTEPGPAFFTMVAELIDQASGNHSVLDLLTDTPDQAVAATVNAWRDMITALLGRAQGARAVDPRWKATDVLAVLAGLCHAARASGWDRRVVLGVTVILADGLRPRS
ncbi:TetR/AcrR family transcriptional regulator [Phytomonospora endophytica]|uniref:AcrR family transcriptional regulator n=1 Tax=Phytomonospora endophytica TaxID=714109 RepID=A0A841FYH8_9ACTN|nr:TetR/AcrR family transcriptional regulator [Phytomonospora endophytica]MBB6038572.1 AcrR family transcriptional regulator [Phytomonospora endophytica]GIG69286.1 TetR family transcriptional regulator [Phytomonospora endophytica]